MTCSEGEREDRAAFWRFQIPEHLQEQWGHPALTESSRRKILGLNSARLYKLPGAAHANQGRDKPVPAGFESLIPNSLKTVLEFPGFASDNFSKMKRQYAEMGGIAATPAMGGSTPKPRPKFPLT